jgi:hypothetical protein
MAISEGLCDVTLQLYSNIMKISDDKMSKMKVSQKNRFKFVFMLFIQ